MGTAGKLTKSEQKAREAIGALETDHIWKLGEYTASGRVGGSTRITAASEFCDRHNITAGDNLEAYLHSDTGALILLPQTPDHE